MIGPELAIEQRETAHFEPRNEPGKCYLRRVAAPGDHAFTEKRATEREPVKPADQLVVDPAFNRMGIALLMQIGEYRLDLAADPCFRPVDCALRAQPDDSRERGVGCYAKSPGHDGFPQRSRQMEPIKWQDRAPLGFDPVDAFGAAIVGHWEHANRIGAKHHPGI